MEEEDEAVGEDAEPNLDADRYKPWQTITHDTVAIMTCKLWACRILQSVCTMRVDIRLSKLLGLHRIRSNPHNPNFP